MSPRNFARHFVQETGITPHEFIERARVDAARLKLGGSDLPLKAVAYDCGFGLSGPDADRVYRASWGNASAGSGKFSERGIS